MNNSLFWFFVLSLLVLILVSFLHFHRARVWGGVAGLQNDRARVRRALHGCKMTAHRCGADYTDAKRPRTGAGRVARLLRHPAPVRRPFHASAATVSAGASPPSGCGSFLLLCGSLIACLRKYSRSSAMRFTRSAASRRSGLRAK